jgi:Mycobacterial 4 TMS phage holin, superfamily IV
VHSSGLAQRSWPATYWNAEPKDDDGAAAAIGLLKALIWPLLARIALPLTVLTLGGAALRLNGVLVTFAVNLLPGAHLDGVLEGIVITVAMTALTAGFYSLLTIDEGDSWYRNVVRRQMRRRGQHLESEVPGVLFLEIDGLAHDVLHRALAAGDAPNLAALLRRGSPPAEQVEIDCRRLSLRHDRPHPRRPSRLRSGQDFCRARRRPLIGRASRGCARPVRRRLPGADAWISDKKSFACAPRGD